MRPLLAEFLVELRELVEEATADLLALERDPDQEDRLEGAFRAFHTLKGSAAILGFAPLTAVLHAAEDLLSATREPHFAGNPAVVVEAALECLDTVSRWLDVVEAEGTLPRDAEEQGSTMAARLRDAAGATAPAPPPSQTEAGRLPDWIIGLGDAEREAIRVQPRLPAASIVAISYDPDPGCFFHGDDPLGLMRQVPNLTACSITPREPWHGLAAMDAYQCNLRIRAVAVAPVNEVRDIFRLVGQQAQIVEIPPGGLVGSSPPPRPAEATTFVRAVLEEQGRMLAMQDGASLHVPNRTASAMRVAANALRALGNEAGAARIEAARGDAAAVARAIAAVLVGAAPERPAAPAGQRQRMLRVDPTKVERLVGLADEMVLARNALRDLLRRAEDELGPERAIVRAMKDQHGTLERLAREWHGSAIRMRMVPVGDIFRRVPRLVRDLSRQLGKQVELEIEGEATEADRDVLEELFEPLVHLLRNSLDHGIETAGERRAAGKPEPARLMLRAMQEGAERVVIEVADDGRGIDIAALRHRAVERGVITAAHAAALSEDEALNLVFAAGVSTAGTITEVSGRGVGMDVVRIRTEAVGGSVAVRSRPGEGTTIRLTLPLSIALAQLLTVGLDGQLFGLPLESVVELVCVPRARIQRLRDGAAAFALGDRVLPLVSLRAALGLAEPGNTTGPDARIVVVRCGDEQAGLEVDAIGERLEAILRPLGGLLSNTRLYHGTTLAGDGRVLLVLNVEEALR